MGVHCQSPDPPSITPSASPAAAPPAAAGAATASGTGAGGTVRGGGAGRGAPGAAPHLILSGPEGAQGAPRPPTYFSRMVVACLLYSHNVAVVATAHNSDHGYVKKGSEALMTGGMGACAHSYLRGSNWGVMMTGRWGDTACPRPLAPPCAPPSTPHYTPGPAAAAAARPMASPASDTARAALAAPPQPPHAATPLAPAHHNLCTGAGAMVGLGLGG